MGLSAATWSPVGFVSAVLGTEYLHHLSRHGPAPESGELGSAFCSDNDSAAAGMGDLESGWTWLPAEATRQIHSLSGILAHLRSFLTAMVGFWATLSLNMPDFTRFGRSQREQAIGQVVALPTTMTVFAAMGVMITSAAMVIYPHMKPEELWDPMKLVGQFHNVAVIAISMFTVVVATLAVNIAANVVSPANDFANAFPKWISFRTGGLITGIIGILMQPWRLLADPSGYIFAWLVGYSGGLGSIAGVLIADYWLVRKKRLALGDLYRTRGVYTYNGGWNWRAIVATLVGCVPCMDRFDGSCAPTALRLRMVRGFWRRGVEPSSPNETLSATTFARRSRRG